MQRLNFAEIPMRMIGPIKIIGPILQEEVFAPLATFETPLWPSTNRGATVSRLTDGIKVVIMQDLMTRSILLEAEDVLYAHHVIQSLKSMRGELNDVVSNTSRFAELQDWHTQVVGKLIFIRFALTTGEASGHNMVTKASDALSDWILSRYPKCTYVSISGNYCTDKKVSAVNGILGRGKYVVAEMVVPKIICEKYLKTTPQKIVDLNLKKNLIGSIINGGVRSANAHFANMLLGFYLATGQDAANIIEGSQGFVHTELKNEDLYFSITLPNLILGTIGNGKQHAFVQKNLENMKCLSLNNGTDFNTGKELQALKNAYCGKESYTGTDSYSQSNSGMNSKRLAAIAASVVLCGELSLLASQTKPGDLMKSHMRLERLEKESTLC